MAKKTAYFKIEYNPEDYTPEQIYSIIREALPRAILWTKEEKVRKASNFHGVF